MPNISASTSPTVLNRTTKEVESNTRNTEELLQLLISEVRRLRLGDTSEEDEELIQ